MLQARIGCNVDGKTAKWQGNDAENKPFYEQKYMKKRLKKEENHMVISITPLQKEIKFNTHSDGNWVNYKHKRIIIFDKSIFSK